MITSDIIGPKLPMHTSPVPQPPELRVCVSGLLKNRVQSDNHPKEFIDRERHKPPCIYRMQVNECFIPQLNYNS